MLPIQRLISSYNNDDRLIVAIIKHDLTTVRYILESNRYRTTINQSLFFNFCRADFNHPITLLAAACHFGSYDVVEILINYFHANINNQQLPGWKTPLHYAILAKSNRFEIVRFLIQNGANVNAQDRHGTTPLMLAVLHSLIDIVRLLLEQSGANVRLYNQYHLTAFDFAKYNLTIIEQLIRYGANVSTLTNTNLFHWLIINKHVRIARLLIEAGYTPPKGPLHSHVRSLKNLCRLKIRMNISGSHFRQRIQMIPVRSHQLIKYLLLDGI